MHVITKMDSDKQAIVKFMRSYFDSYIIQIETRPAWVWNHRLGSHVPNYFPKCSLCQNKSVIHCIYYCFCTVCFYDFAPRFITDITCDIKTSDSIVLKGGERSEDRTWQIQQLKAAEVQVIPHMIGG
jgi:hypothetical protein